MLKVHVTAAGHHAVCHRAGEVVLLRHGGRDNAGRPLPVKVRPAIVVEAAGAVDHVLPLTTTPRYASGGTRCRVPHPERMGLRGESFLMGAATHRVYRCDVLAHIGWVHRQAVDVIADAVALHPLVAEQLHHTAEQIDGE